jgi:hypothetical protein
MTVDRLLAPYGVVDPPNPSAQANRPDAAEQVQPNGGFRSNATQQGLPIGDYRLDTTERRLRTRRYRTGIYGQR